MPQDQPENSAPNSTNVEHLKPYQFKPGESGNPGGRPKKKPLTELYERLASEPGFMEEVEKSIRKMIQSGRMVGQLQLKEMTERLEGKVVQPVEGDINLHMSLSDRMEKARERSNGNRG